MSRFNGRSLKLPPWYEQLYRMTHNHIIFARRHPDKLDEIAKRLGITPDNVLAIVITDEISEGFTLTKKN